ncbi:MAG: hypothetical protein NVS2B8_03080 [Vulcanimicrobiaceae bacterium]
MKIVGYSSWAPDERANAIRLAFRGLRSRTQQDWSLEHFGASDFNDPSAIGRLREAIKAADVLIGWQSMSVEVVERMAALLAEMDAAGELAHVKFLWYDIPDPRLQALMFKSLGFEFDMNKSNPMRELSMTIKRFNAKRNDETIDNFWEAREGFLGMQKMVGAAPLMAKILKKPVFKSLVMIGYWNNRSVKNIENMFLYLMKHFTKAGFAGDVELPEKVENEGIYHPAHKGMFQTPEAYLAWYEPWFERTYGKKPWDRIGFITHDLFLVDWNHPVLDAAIAEWEQRGVGVICSMTAVFNAHIVSRSHLKNKKGENLVGAVYHNVPLYLAGSMFAGAPEASIELIRDLGNPRVYTSPVNAAMSREELRVSKFGVASLEYIGNVVTPETEGIQPLPPICSREAGEEISALEPIPDRVKLLGDVTTRWLKLRHLKNSEKKLAVFVYNFPPGPGNVGVAYFLDVAGSLRSMLTALRAEGYDTGDVDESDKQVSDKLRDMYAGYLNVGAVSAGEMRDWVHEMTPQHEALFYDVFGQPPSTIPIKGLRYGKVLVLLQDMQGMEDMSIIHDKQAPPSPWLLASYRYATRRFNADAMIHVGTHGLVEWSRGKEWCPAKGDYPEFLVDNCPHAYIFNILDPVEASIARRRSYATILSHLCPPLRAVEGSEDLRNLHRLVHDYYNLMSSDTEKRDDVAAEIAEIVERTGLRIESPGGEVVGDWNVLPTGRNMASTDVRMLPREAAQRKGKRTVAQILDAALKERGHYPEAVGVVLWGSEVLESEGVGIAQALDLMGARVAKDRFNRSERAELISLDELGRPRIDILANTSVVFKNTFPGAIKLIHEAAQLAAAADEPHEWNFVKKHSDHMIANGIDPQLARARCFGMGEDAFMGQVGMMLDTGRFEDFNDIGNAWMSDNCNAYIPEFTQVRIKPAPDAQKYLVSLVEIIQQPLIQMASGGPVKEDMFASFTSAFGAAKRAMGQEDTMIVVSDLTKREPTVRNFRNVVVNGVLTRFHSKSWRDAMLEHGYSGVMEFGDIFKAMRSTEAALGKTISPELWKRTVEVTLDDWQRIADANPHKTRELGETLLDTRRRGMWEDADLENALKAKLNELDNDVELATYKKQLAGATGD